jgi:predicted lipoprotein with Yx(FWY)xxD motif
MSTLKVKIVLLGAVATLAAGVLIPVGLASAAKSGSATVSVHRSKFGRILVDSRGRSLYMFHKDMRGKSTCYGACATDWPPLIASAKLRAGSGAKASLLGMTRRKDGRRQVTYKGHPLYRFIQDTKPGQTNGQGLNFFGGEWNLVSPTGARVAEAAGSGSGGYSGGGYGG